MRSPVCRASVSKRPWDRIRGEEDFPRAILEGSLPIPLSSPSRPPFFRPISDLPPLLSLSPPKPLLEAAPWDPKPRSPVSSSPPSLPPFLFSPFGVGVSIPLSSSSEVGRVGCSDGRRPLLYSLAAGENGEAAGPKGGKEEANKLFSPSSRPPHPPPPHSANPYHGLGWIGGPMYF